MIINALFAASTPVVALLGSLAGTSVPPADGQWTTITDETEAISLDVPAEWSDVSTEPVRLPDGSTSAMPAELPQVLAAPFVPWFVGQQVDPGVAVTAVPYVENPELLAVAGLTEARCEDVLIGPYDGNGLSGVHVILKECSGTSDEATFAEIHQLVGNSEHQDATIVVRLVVSSADVEAGVVPRVLDSVRYQPSE